MATKDNYEAIPDVELAVDDSGGSAKEKYPELDEEHAELIHRFDVVVAESSLMDLASPEISSIELLPDGDEHCNFLLALFSPTIAAVCMAILAVVLGGGAGGESFLRNSFPYIDAIIIFLASVKPIQNRFMTGLTPLLDLVGSASDKVRQCVVAYGEDCDMKIGTLQFKAKVAIEPLKATLDTAKKQEAALKKANPEITVPEGHSDLVVEMEDMKGVIPAKVEEALQHLVLDSKHIPGRLRSTDGFFWGVAFPVVMLVLLVQVLAAWLTSALSHNEWLWLCVCVSYGVSVLAIGFIFIFTNVHARLSRANQVMEAMTGEAVRTLQQEGVSSAVEDVFGTKLVAVQKKMLAIFQNYVALDEAVSHLDVGSSADTVETAHEAESASSEENVSPSKRKRGFLGRLLGTSKSPPKN